MKEFGGVENIEIIIRTNKVKRPLFSTNGGEIALFSVLF